MRTTHRTFSASSLCLLSAVLVVPALAQPSAGAARVDVAIERGKTLQNTDIPVTASGARKKIRIASDIAGLITQIDWGLASQDRLVLFGQGPGATYLVVTDLTGKPIAEIRCHVCIPSPSKSYVAFYEVQARSDKRPPVLRVVDPWQPLEAAALRTGHLVETRLNTGVSWHPVGAPTWVDESHLLATGPVEGTSHDGIVWVGTVGAGGGIAAVKSAIVNMASLIDVSQLDTDVAPNRLLRVQAVRKLASPAGEDRLRLTLAGASGLLTNKLDVAVQ